MLLLLQVPQGILPFPHIGRAEFCAVAVTSEEMYQMILIQILYMLLQVMSEISRKASYIALQEYPFFCPGNEDIGMAHELSVSFHMGQDRPETAELQFVDQTLCHILLGLVGQFQQNIGTASQAVVPAAFFEEAQDIAIEFDFGTAIDLDGQML